jgi:hypothetical protein
MTVSDIMNTIESVQNSKKNLTIDSSFEITVGSIELPKGGHTGIPIVTTEGCRNSIGRKRSFIEIKNKDNMCMARAIIMCWAKTIKTKDADISSKGYPSIEEAIFSQSKMSENYYKNLFRVNKASSKKCDAQTKMATLLCQKAGVSCDMMASLNDIQHFENILNVQILVISGALNNNFIYTGTSNITKLYIYLIGDNHFHAISSITGFFRQSYFCDLCLKPYNTSSAHQCLKTCIVCKTGDCLVIKEVKCYDCNMTCRSLECYERHKIPKSEKSMSQCDRYKRCDNCHKVVDSKVRNLSEHKCGDWLCKQCNRFVVGEHECYQRASKHEQTALKHIYFDFETTLVKHSCTTGYKSRSVEGCKECAENICKGVDALCSKCIKCQNCQDPLCGRSIHTVNYCISQSVCDLCKDIPLVRGSTCNGCGSRCTQCEAWDNKKKCFKTEPCNSTCGFRECKFDTGDAFCSFLFTESHKNFTAIAHNMKGFDGIFLLEHCLTTTLKVKNIIYSGSKIMSMSIGDTLNIRVIDSLNFLPMKLAALPKAFGLKELKKGYFPHFYNLAENQNYVGPYPEAHFYGVNFMAASDRLDFLKWHKSNETSIFDFRKEMEDYCRSDVDILRKSCMNFRKLLMGATCSDAIEGGIDPFQSLTIASVCMKIFKTLFLEETGTVSINIKERIGEPLNVACKIKGGKWKIEYENVWVDETLLPTQVSIDKSTYQFIASPIAVVTHKHKDQFSKVSIEWLKLLEHDQNITIQHALNSGEKKIILDGHQYRIDGFEESTNTCYEYH